MMRRLISFLVVAAIGGCDGLPKSSPPDAREAAGAPSPREAAIPAARTPVVAIDADGLRLVDPANGRTRPIAFGQSRADTLASLAFRGTVDTGINTDCGAGPLAWARYRDGLTLQFQHDRFVGWSLDARDGGRITTLSGIGPGSTRTALERAYPIRLPESTLGVEFLAGDLGGLLDGAGRSAKVTHLWAGVTCMFR